MKPVLLYEQVGSRMIETDDLPRVIDPNMIIDRVDTVLDPDVMAEGRWLELHQVVVDYAGRDITRVRIPGIHPMEDQGMWVVHPVSWVANQIIRVLQQIRENRTPPHALQKMVRAYQGIAEGELVGKTGLIRQVVIGARMKRSGRAVLVPNGSYDPAEVGIPGRFFEDMGIAHRDLVLIGRNPTIWAGSIEIVRARRSPDDVVEMHPLLFEQLGADCDGDDVYFVPIPSGPECQKEALAELLGFCRRNARWTKQAGQGPVEWDRVKEQTRERFATTGFSVGPEDVLAGDLSRLEKMTGKKLSEPCRDIATRLEWDKVRAIIAAKNFETLRMKKHLGVVGLACNRLKILAGRVPNWVDSANYMSERLQQTLLDSKHLDGSYSVFDLLAILNKTGEWRGASIRRALDAVAALGGLDMERCRPVMVALYVAYPWMLALEDILPADTERGPFHATLRKLGGPVKATTVLGTLEKQVAKLGYGTHVPHMRHLAVRYSTGLADMANRFFPLHEAIAAREPNRGLTRRIFHFGDVDPSGPCRQAWDVWHDMAGLKC